MDFHRIIKSKIDYSVPPTFQCEMVLLDMDQSSSDQDYIKYNCKIVTELVNGLTSTKLVYSDLNNKEVGTLVLTKLQWGFLTDVEIATYFATATNEILKDLMVFSAQAASSGFYNRARVLVYPSESTYMTYSLKVEDSSLFEELNNAYASAIQTTTHWTDLPQWTLDSVKIDLLEDDTKTYEVESYVEDYFSENFFLVKGSHNFTHYKGGEGVHLLRNYASVDNELVAREMEFKDAKFRLRSGGEVQLQLDPTKLYNCNIYHNVIPFTYLSIDSLYNSYCCIGFPYSENAMTFSAVRNIDICIYNDIPNKCIIESKVLQKNILDICTKKDALLRKQYTDPFAAIKKEKAANAALNPLYSKTDEKGVPVDSTLIDKEGKIKGGLVGPAVKIVDEPLKSVRVDMKSEVHGFELKDGGLYSFKYLTWNYVDKNLKLDYKLFVPPELGSPVDLNYHPLMVSNEEAVQMFTELTQTKSKKKTFRFKTDTGNQDTTENAENQAENENSSIEKGSLDLSGFDKYNTKSKNKEYVKKDVSNNVLENSQFVDYWSTVLQSNGITDLTGEGKYSSRDDLFYNTILSKIANKDIHSSGGKTAKSKVVALLNWDLELKDSLTIKYFKENGIRTGDLIFQKEGCCPVFKSAKAQVEYETCSWAIRIRDPDGVQHFYNNKDEPIEPEEFWCRSCYVPMNVLTGEQKNERNAIRDGNTFTIPTGVVVRLDDSKLTLQCEKRLILVDNTGVKVSPNFDYVVDVNSGGKSDELHPFNSLGSSTLKMPDNVVVTNITDMKVNQQVFDGQNELVSDEDFDDSGLSQPEDQSYNTPADHSPTGLTEPSNTTSADPAARDASIKPTTVADINGLPEVNEHNPLAESHKQGVAQTNPSTPQQPPVNYSSDGKPIIEPKIPTNQLTISNPIKDAANNINEYSKNGPGVYQNGPPTDNIIGGSPGTPTTPTTTGNGTQTDAQVPGPVGNSQLNQPIKESPLTDNSKYVDANNTPGDKLDLTPEIASTNPNPDNEVTKIAKNEEPILQNNKTLTTDDTDYSPPKTQVQNSPPAADANKVNLQDLDSLVAKPILAANSGAEPVSATDPNGMNEHQSKDVEAAYPASIETIHKGADDSIDGQSLPQVTNIFLKSDYVTQMEMDSKFKKEGAVFISQSVLPDGTVVYDTDKYIEKRSVDGVTEVCVKQFNQCYTQTQTQTQIESKKEQAGIDRKRAIQAKSSRANSSGSKKSEGVEIIVNKNVVARISPDGSYVVDHKVTHTRYVRNRFGVGKLIDVDSKKSVPIKIKDHFNYAGDLFYLTELDEIIIYKFTGQTEVFTVNGDYSLFDSKGSQTKYINSQLRVEYDLSNSGSIVGYDQLNKFYFKMTENSWLERDLDDNLVEHFKDNAEVELLLHRSSKAVQRGRVVDSCYYNHRGIRQSTLDAHQRFICNCNKRYWVIEENSCTRVWDTSTLNAQLEAAELAMPKPFQLFDETRRVYVRGVLKQRK